MTFPKGLSEGPWRRLEYVARMCAVHRTLDRGLELEQTILAQHRTGTDRG